MVWLHYVSQILCHSFSCHTASRYCGAPMLRECHRKGRTAPCLLILAALISWCMIKIWSNNALYTLYICYMMWYNCVLQSNIARIHPWRQVGRLLWFDFDMFHVGSRSLHSSVMDQLIYIRFFVSVHTNSSMVNSYKVQVIHPYKEALQVFFVFFDFLVDTSAASEQY